MPTPEQTVAMNTSPELVDWEAICERSVIAICEGKKYLGIIEADVIAVGTLIESVAKLRASEEHLLRLIRTRDTVDAAAVKVLGFAPPRVFALEPDDMVSLAKPRDKKSLDGMKTGAEVAAAILADLLACDRPSTYGSTIELGLVDAETILKKHLGGPIAQFRASATEPDIRITAGGRAVDYSREFNYDMNDCPDGEVLLLSKGGIVSKGCKSHSPGFYRAWAAMPKDNGPKVAA